MILEHLRESARQAHSGTSFSPEKRADGIIRCYSEELEEDLKTMDGNYKEKYIAKLSTWLGRKSSCMSTMITGGANFPVRRNQRANDSEHKAYMEFRNWRERYFKAVNRVPTPSPEEDLDNAVADLDKLIIKQQKMKDANRIIRSKKFDKIILLEEAGWTNESAIKMLKEEVIFPSYSLTNNNAKIKARKQKIEIMKNRIETKETFEKIEFEGGYIDIENDRVIIKHEEKPDRAVIDKIKARGFRWSRNYSCRCRKHTAMALRDAKEIIL